MRENTKNLTRPQVEKAVQQYIEVINQRTLFPKKVYASVGEYRVPMLPIDYDYRTFSIDFNYHGKKALGSWVVVVRRGEIKLQEYQQAERATQHDKIRLVQLFQEEQLLNYLNQIVTQQNAQ